MSDSTPERRGDRSLRIAFFTDSFVPTNDGVAKVTDTLARALRKQGHEVTVFTVRTPASRSWEVRADGVRVRRYSGVSVPSYPQYRIALTPWLPRAPGGRRFDVVHVHTPGFVGLSGWIYARRHGIPSVGTYHTNLPDMLRNSGRNRASRAFFRAWGRFSIDLCRKCDLATAPTEASRADLLDGGRRASEREPRVVPNGVDTGVFRPGIVAPDWRARWSIATRVPLVTFLGRLTRDKGVLRFLSALDALGTDGDWFGVVGGEGPEAAEVRNWIARSPTLTSRVRYLGAVPESEKPALLAQSTVFVLPSLSDTSSVALLEAMAGGAACVVTDRAGPAEISRRSSVGLRVDPERPTEVAAAVRRLLDDAGVRSDEQVRGRAWVEEYASSSRMASEYVDCYRGLVA